jgi:hypothetical protein
MVFCSFSRAFAYGTMQKNRIGPQKSTSEILVNRNVVARVNDNTYPKIAEAVFATPVETRIIGKLRYKYQCSSLLKASARRFRLYCE